MFCLFSCLVCFSFLFFFIFLFSSFLVFFYSLICFVFNFSMCYRFLLNVSVFSCSSCFSVFDESFSSFLVLLSRAGGFGPSFSAWRLALLGVGGWPFPLSGLGLALPSLRLGLQNSFSWVEVGLFSRGEGWPFGQGCSQKGKEGEGPGPTGEGQS